MIINKERVKSILNRRDVNEKKCSLRKILEQNDMESYYWICLNRILDNDLSENHLYLNTKNNDVYLSEESICIFSEILNGYLDMNYLTELMEYLIGENKNIRYENSVYESIRNMKTSEILKMLLGVYDVNVDSSKEAIIYVRFHLICELFSRNILNKMRIKISDKFNMWKFKTKFHIDNMIMEKCNI